MHVPLDNTVVTCVFASEVECGMRTVKCALPGKPGIILAIIAKTNRQPRPKSTGASQRVKRVKRVIS